MAYFLELVGKCSSMDNIFLKVAYFLEGNYSSFWESQIHCHSITFLMCGTLKRTWLWLFSSYERHRPLFLTVLLWFFSSPLQFLHHCRPPSQRAASLTLLPGLLCELSHAFIPSICCWCLQDIFLKRLLCFLQALCSKPLSAVTLCLPCWTPKHTPSRVSLIQAAKEGMLKWYAKFELTRVCTGLAFF